MPVLPGPAAVLGGERGKVMSGEARRKAFEDFARSCGLTMYPDPGGERYLYGVDGAGSCKKSEYAGFMDELWNALVRAKGGENLLLGKE